MGNETVMCNVPYKCMEVDSHETNCNKAGDWKASKACPSMQLKYGRMSSAWGWSWGNMAKQCWRAENCLIYLAITGSRVKHEPYTGVVERDKAPAKSSSCCDVKRMHTGGTAQLFWFDYCPSKLREAGENCTVRAQTWKKNRNEGFSQGSERKMDCCTV